MRSMRQSLLHKEIDEAKIWFQDDSLTWGASGAEQWQEVSAPIHMGPQAAQDAHEMMNSPREEDGRENALQRRAAGLRKLRYRIPS